MVAWFESFPERFETVSMPGSDGIDRDAESFRDLREGQFTPNPQHEHFALFLGKLSQRRFHELRIFALLDVPVEKWRSVQKRIRNRTPIRGGFCAPGCGEDRGRSFGEW